MTNPLDEIFSRSHKLDRSTLEALTQRDLQELRSMTLGQKESPNRIRAMEALVKTGVPETSEVLDTVVKDTSADAYLRASAATQLGRIDQPEAEGVLLNQLPTVTEPVVRMKIVKALARIGSVASLDALARSAREDPDPTVRRQASFSCSVVAYRNGISGYELPVPTSSEILKLDPSSALAVTFGRASAEETQAALASLGDDTYGLTLSNEEGYRIECGALRMLLALDADLVRDGITALTEKGTMLLGLVAQRSSIDGSFSTRLLAFAWAETQDHFNLAVHRTGGQQLLFGSGVVDDGGVNFDLNAVGGTGSMAVLLRGRLQGTLISITEALSSRTTIAQKVPQKAQSPP
jgi:HEAT repeats